MLPHSSPRRCSSCITRNKLAELNRRIVRLLKHNTQSESGLTNKNIYAPTATNDDKGVKIHTLSTGLLTVLWITPLSDLTNLHMSKNDRLRT
jgi:hypothetical protein